MGVACRLEGTLEVPHAQKKPLGSRFRETVTQRLLVHVRYPKSTSKTAGHAHTSSAAIPSTGEGV